jgi:hypothetical protein
MSDMLVKAKKALEALPIPLPITFVTTGPGEPHGLPGAVTGSLRAKDGRALIVPVPESNSMIAGLPPIIKFLTDAPTLVRDLVAELEALEASSGRKSAEKG